MTESHKLLDTVATILLSVAGLATSWLGYQATRWSGVQAGDYTEANSMRTESTRMSTAAGQRQAIDVGLFMSWLGVYAGGDTALEHFHRARFRDEFRPAFEAWLATRPRRNPNAPSSPFVMPEYRSKLADSAAVLERAAARKFEDGQSANEQSDQYVLLAVVLASVLFFAGISQQIPWLPARTAMLVVATVCCVFGIVRMLGYPVE